MKNNSLCSSTFTTFDVSRFRFIQELVIGDECCSFVTTFIISHLMFLEIVRIGENSFTQYKLNYHVNGSKTFTIDSCVKLKYVSIGKYSFSDFGGSFSIKDCPNLSTLIIGDVSSPSYCFYRCSFILTSKILFFSYSYSALPALTELYIGGSAFCDCFTVSFHQLYKLQRISLGEKAFEGLDNGDSSVAFIGTLLVLYPAQIFLCFDLFYPMDLILIIVDQWP